MNITVYLGALEGNDPMLKEAVKELGTWIGESGNSLVYGGSKSGLMGQIAESVLNAGGKVTGVEPQFFIDSELSILEEVLKTNGDTILYAENEDSLKSVLEKNELKKLKFIPNSVAKELEYEPDRTACAK